MKQAGASAASGNRQPTCDGERHSAAPSQVGARLFARYAHAPNALGYCGPAAAEQLRRVACGNGDDADVAAVPALARRFSGAWPYQLLLAEMLGEPDALSEAVGRAYWTGGPLARQVDAEQFGQHLLERFGAQAGHYWQHLTPALLHEASPTHAFHVLGVYPWSRLLATGLPEPLHVLDSCRIRVGRVVRVEAAQLVVDIDRLHWDGSALTVGPTHRENVDYRTPDGTFIEAPAVGDDVAVHWGFACDRLTPEERADLLTSTAAQVELTCARL